MSKTITLFNSEHQVIIDDEDFERVSQFTWYVLKNKKNDNIYAVRTYRQNNKTINIRLHRFIMNIEDSSIHIDHINHNTLDNRKSNLRICNPAENARNAKKSKVRRSTSKYKGVRKRKDSGKYEARIRVYGKLIVLGSFVVEKDAALAYNKAAKELFGEFAFLNEIGD